MSHFFIWGLVAHIVADWFLQNDWHATYKTSIKHRAAWIHSGIHFAVALLVFPWTAALGIAAAHILIDTRTPLIWWRRAIGQKMHDPNLPPHDVHNLVAMHVAFWQDQMAHVLVIAAAAWWCSW